MNFLKVETNILSILRTASHNPDFQKLTALFDEYLVYIDGDKKAEPIEVQEQELAAIPVVAQAVEMSPEECRAMIELAKNAGPDDCEMCGS